MVVPLENKRFIVARSIALINRDLHLNKIVRSCTSLAIASGSKLVFLFLIIPRHIQCQRVLYNRKTHIKLQNKVLTKKVLTLCMYRPIICLGSSTIQILQMSHRERTHNQEACTRWVIMSIQIYMAWWIPLGSQRWSPQLAWIATLNYR